MSVFNPELREFRESGFEAGKFSPEVQAKLLAALDAGKESFSDIVACPNETCRNPVQVIMRSDAIELSCLNCGWNSIVRRVQS